MFLSLLGGIAVSEGISLLLEGSALAITTYYTEKTARKTTSTRRK